MDNYTLFTPGPVDIPDEINREMNKPLIYHRENRFAQLLDEIGNKLKQILQTKNRIYFLTASGTGAMEAASTNILSANDEALILVCGKFGERWAEICDMHKIKTHIMKVEFGKTVTPDAVEAKLKTLNRPVVIFTTLTETSTGALSDIKATGDIARRHDCLFVVDGIAGLAADPCPQDEWYIDVLIGASQKAFMSPPGISFYSVNDRAYQKMMKDHLPNYYFSIELAEKYYQKGQTPFTPAINVLFAFRKGVDMIIDKGIDKNLKNHREIGDFVRKRVKKMGLELLPEQPSNALTVFKMNDNQDSTEIIRVVKERYNILFANGQAELRGKIIRIGHMGNYTISKLDGAINVMESVIKELRG
ncbi:hypothetical protein A2Y85_07335 [candidate division WOR-3 bacterium RBG_13_43_14]|uniref:Aminotransferase class V domain-containing protein n=1 Tax=candidate division WOR-3 bacterium RBG_13_43_14 TaxID=1802590 RepID=A0A1F4U1Z4_UNCW3|nr:MAG: hypothetical protein A2Y85_07335 [candidate division WOR-3 bacterium RBG_13_43_14]